MTKYLYYAIVRGSAIQSSTIKDFVVQFNDVYGYPVLTNHKTYNYFLRPHRMKRVLPDLAQFNIKRLAVLRDASPAPLAQSPACFSA